MTQRVFDVYNKDDMRDLFRTLPDKVRYIKRQGDFNYMLDRNMKLISVLFHFNIKWRDAIIISRSDKDESKWIGCLCWFWNYNYENRVMNLLSEIIPNSVYPYISGSGISYQNCLPIKRNEIKFVEDAK